MKRYIFIIILICSSITAIQAQGLSDFKYLGDPAFDELYIGVSGSYAHVTNTAAYHPELHDLQGWTGKIDVTKLTYEQWKVKYKFQHRLFADLWLIVDNQINGNGSYFYRQISSGITTGILGWHSWGLNLTNFNKLSIAIGMNLNDYFYGKTYSLDTSNSKVVSTQMLISPEPQGYYFTAGPSLFIDYTLNKYLLIQSLATYSVSYWKAVGLTYGINDPTYPKPHFVGLYTELVTPWGLFVSYDYNFVVNRGNNPDKTKRRDLNIGFRFVL
jgi:hypothetical protein